MNTIKLITRLAIIVIALSFFTCRKHDAKPSGPPQGQGTGTVSGTITDLNNAAVANATVTGGTATTTTDASGKFTLAKVVFTTDSVVVNVTKDGFFQASKSFVASGSIVNNASVQLIAKPASATVAASSGGNVTIPGGGSAIFNSGFVNAANGSAYTGNVSVSAIYLNPTDQNFNKAAPGNLKSAGASNQTGTLTSFGVTAVELNDVSGNKLQLALGKTATITLPIPTALLSKAPASIPLWYFDAVKGWWQQEGTATKQGNNYVGTVSHFSFWNAGDLAGAVNLKLSITDSISGAPFTGKLVTITRLDSSTTSGNTDSTGTVSGLVPVNELLLVKVFGSCGALLSSKNIGPLSKDTLIKIAVINSCQPPVDTSQYVYFTLNGNNYSWKANDSISAFTDTTSWQSYLAASNHYIPGNNYNSISFSFNSGGAIQGTYNSIFFYGLIDNVHYIMGAGQPITISQFDGAGGYISGTSSGQLLSTPDSSAHPYTMSFKLKRLQ